MQLASASCLQPLSWQDALLGLTREHLADPSACGVLTRERPRALGQSSWGCLQRALAKLSSQLHNGEFRGNGKWSYREHRCMTESVDRDSEQPPSAGTSSALKELIMSEFPCKKAALLILFTK